MGRLGLGILDGSHHVAAVRRNLRHETESLDGGRKALARIAILERTPADHILIADRHVLRHRDQGVHALVILRPVDVQPQGAPVARKRVTVGAGGEIVHHHFALRFGYVAQPPLHQVNRGSRQRLDHAFLGGRDN